MLTTITAGSMVRATTTVMATTASGVRRVYPKGTVFEVANLVDGSQEVVCKCPRLGLLVRVPADGVEPVTPGCGDAD